MIKAVVSKEYDNVYGSIDADGNQVTVYEKDGKVVKIERK